MRDKMPAVKHFLKMFLDKQKPATEPVEDAMDTSEENVTPDDQFWARISYYEAMKQQGPIFLAKTRPGMDTIIDNAVVPDTATHFSLGKIPGTGHRNSTMEAVRRNIGKGIALHHGISGNVYLQSNCSDGAVFVHSWEMNIRDQMPETFVRKISFNGILEVFNMDNYRNVLERTRTAAQNVDIDMGEWDPYIAANRLQDMAFVHVSFIKGFGGGYHRKDVTSTPCWLEIQLRDPLVLLDAVVQELKGPLSRISSQS